MSLTLLLTALIATANAAGPGVTKNCFIKPCQLRGDFDGDHKQDQATLVASKDGKKGIQIKLKSGKVFLIGAGTSIGNGGDDFKWMDYWKLQKERIGGDPDSPPRKAHGDFLDVGKAEAASALIYWTGSGFDWHQQGD